MSNRIVQVILHDRSVAPVAAEVWVTVIPEHQSPTTEVRGRLMGPRCPYASTVEVAYPLRPLPPSHSETPPAPGLTRRVVIPEASLWEPESPFLYEGPVELWQNGQRCDRLVVRHGLRTLTLGSRGLLVNGRPLALRGRFAESWSEEQVRARHDAGDNLIVGPVKPDAAAWWDAADRFGMLVLGRLKNADATTEKRVMELCRRPSCLGWLLDGEEGSPTDQALLRGVLDHAEGTKVGVALDRPPKDSLPVGAHFLVVPSANAALFAESGVPLLLTGDAPQEPLADTILGVLSKSPCRW